MLLRQHSQLGLLPEIVVLAFLCGGVLALGYTTLLVLVRTPVLLVADAEGCQRIEPARADDHYLRSFASDFLQHWESWNCYTCTYRQGEAIRMMAPQARDATTQAIGRADSLRGSLQQSQDLVLTRMDIAQRDAAHGLFDVAFRGEVTTYFGGVGGDADACQGHLYVHAIIPTSSNPLCLEVVGFIQTTPVEASP